MNYNGAQTISSRFRIIGRVLLFMFACAFALAAAAPFIPNLSGKWSELCLGVVASLAAFVLTVLFVRWDRLRLTDVGAIHARTIECQWVDCFAEPNRSYCYADSKLARILLASSIGDFDRLRRGRLILEYRRT